jgi:hypothetical protein
MKRQIQAEVICVYYNNKTIPKEKYKTIIKNRGNYSSVRLCPENNLENISN